MAKSLKSVRKLLHQFWGAYCSSLHRLPLVTKMLTAMTIFTTSDLATQYLTQDIVSSRNTTPPTKKDKNRVFEINYQRTCSASFFGVIGTVYLHYWWNFLERFINVRFPFTPLLLSAGTSHARRRAKIVNTLAKVAIDQSISAPLYFWCYFLITNFVHPRKVSLSGNDIGTITTRAQAAANEANKNIAPLMLQHWRIWPMVHFLNFYFTPIQKRVLVQNLLLVGWSGYLSYFNHSRDLVQKIDGVHGTVKLKRRNSSIMGIDAIEEDVEM